MERQHDLFAADPTPWEMDEAAEALIATVVLPEAPWGPFDYLVPMRLAAQAEAGRRVRVPLGRGNRMIVGYCVAASHRPVGSRRLKEVHSVIDSEPLLSPALMRLTHWLADRYLCPLGQALEGVLPSGVRSQAGTRETTFLSVSTEVAARIDELKLPKKQAEILRVLAASPRPMTPPDLAQACECTQGPIMALRKKSLVVAEIRRVQHADLERRSVERESGFVLNDEQQRAFEAIVAALHARCHETFLLHGVTGSGKTEVYIRAIEEVISFGRQAIVLVPEISLTPQTWQRFRSRFEHVALLHSHLSDVERHWHWQRIASGQIQVVVGARSAVFAPARNLGLIVIDEEHDGSFKQGSAPRYHARDVAHERARLEGVPLVLGSATPSLESWHAAQQGEIRLIEMPYRIENRPLPDVATIDLRTDMDHRGPRNAISRPLHQAIRQTVSDGNQAILLLNRRGFSTHIQCPACGHVVTCLECDIALTHHRDENKAMCHYCDYTIPAPEVCPQCSFAGLRYSGIGTQRLEAEVQTRFPEATNVRMDSDTMRRPNAHERALARFRTGEAQILLGTQMIAKGLDFPNVTLVGVVNADTALHLPDFRAAERTFQLVTQVAGRTGRGEKGGRVLVQTFEPDHPAIQAAVRHDYRMFADRELPSRRQYGYPPYASMIRIVVRGPDARQAEDFAESARNALAAAIEREQFAARVVGPAPAPFAILRSKHRFHMLLIAEDGARLRQLVAAFGSANPPPEEVEWVVDVDPLEML